MILAWHELTESRRRDCTQPLFNICDPYLNAFRGIIPPIGGIDLSPILAFTLLNVLSSSMGAYCLCMHAFLVCVRS